MAQADTDAIIAGLNPHRLKVMTGARDFTRDDTAGLVRFRLPKPPRPGVGTYVAIQRLGSADYVMTFQRINRGRLRTLEDIDRPIEVKETHRCETSDMAGVMAGFEEITGLCTRL